MFPPNRSLRASAFPQFIANLLQPNSNGIVEQVGASLRGLNLCTAKELVNHRQRHAA